MHTELSDRALVDLDFGPLVLRANLQNWRSAGSQALCGTQNTYLLHTHSTHLVASLDSLVDALAKNQTTKHTTRESIASTVGVDNFGICQRRHREHLRVLEVRGVHDCRGLGSVCDDDRARARRIGLGLRGDCARDRGEILGVRKAVGGGPSLSFCLVADDNVAVGHDLLQLDGEELRNEGRGEVEDENLAGRARSVSTGDGRKIWRRRRMEVAGK